MTTTQTDVARASRTLVVDQSHPTGVAQGAEAGTAQRPYRTIGAAAAVAMPGDTILIHQGIYRERVVPARSGEPGRPITYTAAAGHRVCIRGSEVFKPTWKSWGKSGRVLSGSLASLPKGQAAYNGLCDPNIYAEFNPYLLHFNRGRVARPHQVAVEELRTRLNAAQDVLASIDPSLTGPHQNAAARKAKYQREFDELDRSHRRRHLTTMGQVFVDGNPMGEVECIEDLEAVPGSWMVSPEGDAVLIHPDASDHALSERLVELSVRHTAFAPLERGLGYITIRGLIIEHAANHFPTWGKQGWGQAGLVSCRSGHHWVIQDNIIRFAKGVGVDCGREGGSENMEFPDTGPHADGDHGRMDVTKVGYHLIERNHISDHGHCGMAGIGHTGTRVLHNVIERNNRDGYTSPWWEFAGIKFHFFFDGIIEGNLIRDNEAHGIWLDNQWRGSRVTRNLIVNNLWSGINVELGRGPVLIDHNIIAHTRQGDGIYGHDCADITIVHNLIYANANFGVWFAFATPRVKPDGGCRDISVLQNMILGNRAGAVALPLPWEYAGNNRSENNLLMGAGEYLDEGGGPQPPLFQLTHCTHMATMQPHLPVPAMTRERGRQEFVDRLKAAGIPESQWPNLEHFDDHMLIPLALWQAVLDSDKNSEVIKVIRDGLNSRRLSWCIDLPAAACEARCDALPGLDWDYRGVPLPDAPRQPGPFQGLIPGMLDMPLWPIAPVAR